MTARRDMVVVGGGPAGAAFALALAAAGRDVVLVEREAGPHDKVCGEFLSGEALFYLGRLGVSPEALGAVPVSRATLSRGRLSATRTLPFAAMSLSRRTLDEALLVRAAQAGATVLRGRAVRMLERGGEGWIAALDDGGRIEARDAALACGKHELRGRPRPAGLQNDLIGLKLHLRPRAEAAATLDGTVVLGLFEGGYAGLEPIEGDLANLCLVVRRSAFAALGRDWDALSARVAAAAPAIGRALAASEPMQDKPLAIARIPYGFVAGPQDGPWRLGDQAAVIPSFAGEGISIALHSARLAAEALVAGEAPCAYLARLAADVGLRVRTATLLSQALVHGGTQALAALAAWTAPAALSAVAAATRIPDRALAARAA